MAYAVGLAAIDAPSRQRAGWIADNVMTDLLMRAMRKGRGGVSLCGRRIERVDAPAALVSARSPRR
jgi:hypothetical protein